MVAFKQAAVTAAFPNFEAFFGDCVKKSYVRTLFYYVLAYYYINTAYFCVTSEDSKIWRQPPKSRLARRPQITLRNIYGTKAKALTMRYAA